MHQIWYEQYSPSNPKFRAYKLRKNQQIQQLVFHKNLRKIIDYTENYPKYKHIFMLDESRFSFFRIDIFLQQEEKITIQDLQKIIKEKCEDQRKLHHLTGDKLVSYIDTIYVNWEEKKYVIWESGEIFFRLYNIYVKKTTVNTFNSIYGNVLQNKNIELIPQSFHTLMFLRNTLKKENFLLMYINDINCKIIKVENGFYKSVELINLWINALKQMYKDNDIQQYRYGNYDRIEWNSLAKNLVIKTIQFYVRMLCKWMYDYNLIGTDVIVVSPIIKNGHFIEVFNQEYSTYTNNYIVPFHHSDQLENFDFKRDPDDMDPLVIINRKKLIK